jgi:phosphoglycerate dehydrogenase-like enzyme
MKRTARLVNTARDPIVDQTALVNALQARTIAEVAIDVFDSEPLPNGHPFRTLENVIATPHIGYVIEELAFGISATVHNVSCTCSCSVH